MIGIRKIAALTLLAGFLTAAAPAGPDGDPANYTLRVPIDAAKGSVVQRLTIPAEVLAASQAADLADVRIFDADNRAMPMARIAPNAGGGRSYALAPLPILGSIDALNVTGVSLRLDGDGRARVARIDGTQPTEPAKPMVVGVLLDTRAIAGSASGLAIAADVPRAQPVTFAVEASSDLKNWRPLAENVVYRGATTSGNDAVVKVPLGDTMLGHDYLRITWQAASRLLSPVTVRKATLLMRPAAAGGGWITAAPPPLSDPHAIEFAVPFATPLDTIRVMPTGNEVIIPIRLLGRDNSEQSWAVLGEGTAARRNYAANVPRDIVLSAGTYRALRIEADRRSTGFTSAPTIAFGFAPREVVFVAGGRAPFHLAAGREAATDTYLPLDSVMTQAGSGALPVATARAPRSTLQLQPVNAVGAARRQLLLWAILLTATALLGAMAWTLWRRGQAGSDAS
ncbi:MAG: DUF3999 family protein [Sphingomonadaceae bacterium]|nr:DUF3999 family protein [Sphingomonadaceae bacterium]